MTLACLAKKEAHLDWAVRTQDATRLFQPYCRGTPLPRRSGETMSPVLLHCYFAGEQRWHPQPFLARGCGTGSRATSVWCVVWNLGVELQACSDGCGPAARGVRGQRCLAYREGKQSCTCTLYAIRSEASRWAIWVHTPNLLATRYAVGAWE